MESKAWFGVKQDVVREAAESGCEGCRLLLSTIAKAISEGGAALNARVEFWGWKYMKMRFETDSNTPAREFGIYTTSQSLTLLPFVDSTLIVANCLR